MLNNHKTLTEIHEDVPADHYDQGIRRNLFQKFWHHRRFNEVLKLISDVDGPVLDIGCHGGKFTEQILKKIGTKKIFGIDISPSAIELAKKRIPFGNFQVADATHLPYRSDFFETVFCLEVLEHVDEPVAVLREIYRVMKKGAYALLLVPSDNKLFKIIWFLWILYYPVWKHAHVQSYSKNSLERLIEQLNFKIIYIKTFNMGMLKIIVFIK